MTLDPRVSIYLNLALAVLMGIGGYLASNADFMHSSYSALTLLVIGAVIAAINSVLHAIPSKPGALNEFPLGPKTPPKETP